MKKYLGFAIALFSTQTFAFFCPTNFSQINPGETIDQVTAICGAADSTKTTTTEAPVPQEWTYYVNPTGSNTGQPPQTTTLKMTVAFSAEGKVGNITVNGQSLITTPICNGNSIQVGDDDKAVKKACGDPGFVNKGQAPSGSAGKETQTTELKYNSTPPVTLIFVDGKLSSRK